MPFFVVGFLMVATVPLHIYLMPPIKGKYERFCTSTNIITLLTCLKKKKPDNVKASQAVGSRSKGVIKLLIIPSAFVVGAVITVTSNFWASLDPTLEPHLREVRMFLSYRYEDIIPFFFFLIKILVLEFCLTGNYRKLMRF